MEVFVNVGKSWKVLTFFAKIFFLDVWQGSEYAFDICSYFHPRFAANSNKITRKFSAEIVKIHTKLLLVN